MGRKKKSSILNIFMNGSFVGQLQRLASGKLEFIYSDEWMISTKRRSISLSLPVFMKRHSGDIVEHFFSNILPDNKDIRERIQTRFGLLRNTSFDLLSEVGRDCIGALQLIPEGYDTNIKSIITKSLPDREIANLLKSYRTAPLGMADDNDFRISIAGAQEKTALLWYEEKWNLPLGATPTSHIFKLPIGFINRNGIDLKDSVENEWLCHLILKGFKIPVANAEIKKFEDVNVLVIERFDRIISPDKSWIMRLPQEDMCQACGISSALKYESQGGPGIVDIMSILGGSSNNKDQYIFMKTVFLFWLLGAIDGHGKNFSIFLKQQDRYHLTPMYDVLSAYPIVAKKQLEKQKIKMAMAVKGKSKHYSWDKIQIRHWLTTAKECGFSKDKMMGIINEILSSAETTIEDISKNIPEDFPVDVSEPIFQIFLAKCREIQKYQL